MFFAIILILSLSHLLYVFIYLAAISDRPNSVNHPKITSPTFQDVCLTGKPACSIQLEPEFLYCHKSNAPSEALINSLEYIKKQLKEAEPCTNV